MQQGCFLGIHGRPEGHECSLMEGLPRCPLTKRTELPETVTILTAFVSVTRRH